MILATAGSREAVGSSRRRSLGLFNKAFANPTRVCSPEDRRPQYGQNLESKLQAAC